MRLDDIMENTPEERRFKLWALQCLEVKEMKPGKGDLERELSKSGFLMPKEEGNLRRCEWSILLKVDGFITSSWRMLTENNFTIEYSFL